jgi:hypothetical protein
MHLKSEIDLHVFDILLGTRINQYTNVNLEEGLLIRCSMQFSFSLSSLIDYYIMCFGKKNLQLFPQFFFFETNPLQRVGFILVVGTN